MKLLAELKSFKRISILIHKNPKILKIIVIRETTIQQNKK